MDLTPEKNNEPDVWIGKWSGHVHYYAKVKGENVVDKDGNSRWNTYKAAKAAVEYFKTID